MQCPDRRENRVLSVIKQYPVVVLGPTSWDFVWQRYHIFTTHFASAGHRVIFVGSIGGLSTNYLALSSYIRFAKKLWCRVRRSGSKSVRNTIPQSLTLYSPLVVPSRPRVLRWVNNKVFVPQILREIAGTNIQSPIVLSYLPTDTALQVARGLEPRALIYDCASNFSGMPGVPGDISQTERELLNAADLVLVDSSFLRQKHAGVRPDMVQIPPGVNYELFNQAYSTSDFSTPVQKVCFFGLIDTARFDFDLVERIADAGFEVSLIGHKRGQHHLFNHINVEYIPPVSQANLPELLKPMDALIIPYKRNKFTQGIFPNKIYECLATGKPVVATPLPDLQQGELSKHVYLASDAQEFIDVLRRLPEPGMQERIQSQLVLARENSWESRFHSIYRELERVLHV